MLCNMHAGLCATLDIICMRLIIQEYACMHCANINDLNIYIYNTHVYSYLYA